MNIFLKIALSIFLIIGPIVGYIPQYYEILSTRNVEGFSTMVSFILLISNIIRILFWILKRFDITLLYQSIVMIVAQIALLELITRIRLAKNGLQFRHHYNLALGIAHNSRRINADL